MVGARLRSMLLIGLFVAAAWLAFGYASSALGTIDHSAIAEMADQFGGDESTQRDDGVASAGLGGVALIAGYALLRLRRIAFKLKVLALGFALAIPMSALLFYVTATASGHL